MSVDMFLATALSQSPPEIQPHLEAFRDLYSKKLWHQLTNRLFDFYNLPASAPYRVDVYEHFIKDFESKVNQLRLAQLAVTASKSIDNPQDFLKSLLERIKERGKNTEAQVLLLSTLANAKLTYGDLEGTKKDMDAALELLDEMASVEPSVSASYYLVAADYYRARADYAPYYKNALLYLACLDPSQPPEDPEMRASSLGIAALLADSIYNFGELLQHPILDSLTSPSGILIRDLLFVFNEGDIGKFEVLGQRLPSELSILKDSYGFLRQKICLMALIEAVFKRSADNRRMDFQTIAAETRLPVDEVEHLVMKALSLKLLRGSLDQTNRTARFTWVQPRVLSRSQIGGLADRLTTWLDKLNKVEMAMAPEVLAAV